MCDLKNRPVSSSIGRHVETLGPNMYLDFLRNTSQIRQRNLIHSKSLPSNWYLNHGWTPHPVLVALRDNGNYIAGYPGWAFKLSKKHTLPPFSQTSPTLPIKPESCKPIHLGSLPAPWPAGDLYPTRHVDPLMGARRHNSLLRRILQKVTMYGNHTT